MYVSGISITCYLYEMIIKLALFLTGRSWVVERLSGGVSSADAGVEKLGLYVAS